MKSLQRLRKKTRTFLPAVAAGNDHRRDARNSKRNAENLQPTDFLEQTSDTVA